MLPLIQQNICFDDQTGLVVNEIERDLSFNLLNIIKSHLTDKILKNLTQKLKNKHMRFN